MPKIPVAPTRRPTFGPFDAEHVRFAFGLDATPIPPTRDDAAPDPDDCDPHGPSVQCHACAAEE